MFLSSLIVSMLISIAVCAIVSPNVDSVHICATVSVAIAVAVRIAIGAPVAIVAIAVAVAIAVVVAVAIAIVVGVAVVIAVITISAIWLTEGVQSASWYVGIYRHAINVRRVSLGIRLSSMLPIQVVIYCGIARALCQCGASTKTAHQASDRYETCCCSSVYHELTFLLYYCSSMGEDAKIFKGVMQTAKDILNLFGTYLWFHERL